MNQNLHSVALVKAMWHKDIVDEFAHSFIESLAVDPQYTIDTYDVPGVVEIPLLARKLIATGRYGVVVVTGLIVDHGVYRHDFVARTVMDATMRLQMDTGTPVIYGILTPQEFLSEGRPEFFKSHFRVKGEEAAHACMKTVDNLFLLEGRFKEAS